MTCPPGSLFSSFCDQAYADGYALHGDLQLGREAFHHQLQLIIAKPLGADASPDAALMLFDRLHTDDLYLSTACAVPSDAAWRQFDCLYQSYLQRAAAGVCATPTAARELAESLPAYLFLPDKAGHSRLASYDGRSSLITWLTAILYHEASKDRERKYNHSERLDDLPEMADDTAIERLETDLRAQQYGPVIQDSFIQAIQGLSTRERLILTLRYEEGLDGAAIAGVLGVHPSTVSRGLHEACEKLRDSILSTLSGKYHLTPPSLHECVADILENPGHSILSLLGCTK